MAPVGKVKVRPFVKWTGGKSQLLPVLVPKLPRFNRYFEPFVGGGALFFELQPKRAYLSDINPELINCYKVVKRDVDALIDSLKKHKYQKTYYYKIRDVDRKSEYSEWTDVERAARFIYMNKTCFNGLYRVNSRGEFNVPFGCYKNPTIVDEPNLRACSEALRRTRIELAAFDKVVKHAKKGDFVYFDPPYVPLNDTSYFTSYTKDGFDADMQARLRDVCKLLDKSGVQFMVSNSYTDFVLDLYSEFNLKTVDATRAINCNGSGRGRIKEVIVTNYNR